MIIKESSLLGCYTIEPKLFSDDRGHFFESFNQKLFEENIKQKIDFVQDNQSFSNYGVVRGLHYQIGEFAQAKLVRVIQGKVLDVAVDLRKDSKTYGQWYSIVLSESNKMQLFLPRGFAHGFSVLSETAIFSYKCDNYYNKSAESGICFDDGKLNIDWQIPYKDIKVSEKDLKLPNL